MDSSHLLRCPWATREPNLTYHDTEWGVPAYEDTLLFEFLILEGAQAGLSWETVLKKRLSYREAFDHFDPEKIAQYTEKDQARLMENSGIIRNRLKIQSTITNAQAFLQVQQEFGSFSQFLWAQFPQAPIVNHWKVAGELPASSPESDRLSKLLKQKGFRFIGTTICYAYMQAVGIIDDHLTTCFIRTGKS